MKKRIITSLVSLVLVIASLFSLSSCVRLFGKGSDDTPNEGIPGGNSPTTPPQQSSSTVDEAVSCLDGVYENKESNTPADYTLIGKVIVKGDSYTVSWTANDERIAVAPVIGTNLWNVDVPENVTEQINYTLTATVTASDGSFTRKTYGEFVVPVTDVPVTPPNSTLGEAVEYLNSLYENCFSNTPNDYDLVGKIDVNGDIYTVDWVIDNSNIRIISNADNPETWTVCVPDSVTEQIDYSLIATVTAADGNSSQTVFDGLYVPVNTVFPYTREGEYIYFGEYPQSIKADGVSITAAQDSRGYYLGTDGSYYAMVVANPYEAGYTFSTGEGVGSDAVYYFKVEPIRWRIISETSDVATILCDSIIANKSYQSYYSHDTVNDKYVTDANGAPEGTYANNYKYSEVRAWLNNEFYNNAFSSLQKQIILTTTVDNSVESTGYDTNPYVCEDTEDKIFLPSYTDIINTEYGFNADTYYLDIVRQIKVSDYSRATGAYMSTNEAYYGNGYWWMRSPYYYISNLARCISYDGIVYSRSYYIRDSYYGVVPVINISLNGARLPDVDEPNEEIPENDTLYTGESDYAPFGEYLQTVKADEIIITAAQDSCGYYLGTDGSANVSELVSIRDKRHSAGFAD